MRRRNGSASGYESRRDRISRQRQEALEMIRGERAVPDTPADYFARLQEAERRYREGVQRSLVLATDDRRRFHPAGRFRPAGSFVGEARRLVVRSTPKWTRDVSHMIGFALPEWVAVCVRRKQRREVIHAKKLQFKGGRGGAGRRNWMSDIVC